MKYEFLVVTSGKRPSVEAMIGVLNLVKSGEDTISITHISMKEFAWLNNGKFNPSDLCLLLANGEHIRNIRGLFLFLEKNALWPM